MKMIRTENITKKYKRYKKQEGMIGSIKGLFHREYEEKIAVAGLEFHTMISYYIISSYLFQMEKSAEISQQMTGMLRNGTFSKYMVIPVQTQGYFVAMEAGKLAFSSGIGFLATVLWFCLFRISIVPAVNWKISLCGMIMVVLGLLFMALSCDTVLCFLKC